MVRTRQLIVASLLILGVGGFLSATFFYDHLAHVSPASPVSVTDQLRPLRFGEYIFYVTSSQLWVFSGLLSMLGFAPLGMALGHYWKFAPDWRVWKVWHRNI